MSTRFERWERARTDTVARLFVLVRLSYEWHTGQWSQGYRIGCTAQRRLRSLGYVNYPWDRNPRTGYGPEHWRPEFRNRCAYFLRKYRHAFKRNG